MVLDISLVVIILLEFLIRLSGSPNITVTDIDGTQSIISGVSISPWFCW